ncbi:MAG: carboxypeptidase regulatory-like domain-containing protein [Planctomycetes bacterium]|nr:carboxypeptidase regulatory-like domain-containing protein [Planctomycetota bacterium]MCB9825429.1 carboxypeptidase regulatory-like domain-containing protein [Planctomycetota bacterium]
MNGRGLLVIAVVGALAAALAWQLSRSEQHELEIAPDGPRATADSDSLAGVTGPALQGSASGPGAVTTPDVPADTPPGEGEDGRVLFRGIVVRPGNTPAPGVQVDVTTDEGLVATATTDAEGAYTFRHTPAARMARASGFLRAHAEDGAVAVSTFWFQALSASDLAESLAAKDERQLPLLTLRPSVSLDVEVTSTCSGGLPASLRLGAGLAMSNVALVEATTDAAGHARLEGLPPGEWILVAFAEGCARARAVINLPRDEGDPVRLELGEAAPVVVTVQDAEEGTPIAGAEVHVVEHVRLQQYGSRCPLYSEPAVLVTDEAGRAIVATLAGDEQLTLRADAEGYPSSEGAGAGRGGGPGVARVAPGTREVVIELRKPLTVRWPLEDKGHGIPPDGSHVSIVPWTNTGRLVVPPDGVIERGELVVAGWSSTGASGYAVLEGFGIARLSAQPGQEEGRPTAFYPARYVEAVVRHADGSPAEGWHLRVLDQGNNPVKPPVATNADGLARMDLLYGGPMSLVNVSVTGEAGYGGIGIPVGAVNLAEQSGHFEVRIPEARTVRLRVTILGKAPTDSQEVTVSGAGSGWTAIEGRPGCYEATWTPVGDTPGLYLKVASPGCMPIEGVRELGAFEDGDEIHVNLEAAGALRIHVKEPEDKRYGVTVQRWDEGARDWKYQGAFASGPFRPNGSRADANGVIDLPAIPPGRVRAIDTQSGLASEGVEVVVGSAPAELTLDLSRSGWIKGTVRGPEGVSLKGATVRVVEDDKEPTAEMTAFQPSPTGRPINAQNGEFWIRGAEGRRVTLRVWHPTLSPHATRGQVVVSGPGDGHILELVEGATTTVRLDTPARTQVNPGREKYIVVRLYKGEPEGEGVKLLALLSSTGDSFVFGGYEPGTWTLWADVPGFAPVVLRDVVLGAKSGELGPATPPAGATLELHVHVAEGQSPPRFSLWARRLDDPSYSRRLDGSATVLRLRGLGAGRFELTGMAYGGSVAPIKQTIEVDGTNTVVVEVDGT